LLVVSDLQAQLVAQQAQVLAKLIIDSFLVTGSPLHRLQVNTKTIELRLEIGLIASQRFDVGTDASRGVILEFLDRPFSFAEPAFHFQEIALHLQILLCHHATAQQQTGNQDSQATNLQHQHAPDRRGKRLYVFLLNGLEF
jgi:hypothetical protein